MIRKRKASEAEMVFAGGGEMGALMRSHDWSQTPLGSVQSWPQSLKTAVRIMLTSRQPMFVWWGEDLINLYNDAYRDILGGKHPAALGQSASALWHEIWDQIGPRAESAMDKNEGTYDEALLLIMERNGYSEETYYTFSYSPIPNEQGGAGGIICANTEDTSRILSKRQLALLRILAAKTADARTFAEACTVSADCLGANPYDLPWATIYLVNPDRQGAVLAGTSGIQRGHALCPDTLDFADPSLCSFDEILKTNQIHFISDVNQSPKTQQAVDVPTGAWSRSPHQAVVVPILAARELGKAALLIAGLNPFRLFDHNYREFIQDIATQIAASLTNAQSYEEERQRVEALAELDRAKTTFFSNISHEFRTPLMLMLSPLEDMLAVAPEEPLANHQPQLDIVHRNGLRLLKLVNTLLDFSRIEAGRVQAVYEPTDLAQFTLDLSSVFRSAIERGGLRLRLDCDPLPEPVYIDREMWEKIVLNLLSNAFKFTFEGEISVSLRWQGDRVELAVQDTGIGIPDSELPDLFKRFHRVKDARGRSFEGSGIGLSLVKELAQLQRGSVSVTSTFGQGSCFRVLIPTGYAHLPPDQISRQSLALLSTPLGAASYLEEAFHWLPETEGQANSVSPFTPGLPVPEAAYSRRRILLVDDNADMRHYVKRLLSERYQVEAVNNGLVALMSIRQQLPDLVLTDVMMPELDGMGLLQELRSDPQTRSIPVILLSAQAEEDARVEGIEAGADDYLVKPFSARELLARVEGNLKMAEIRQEAAQREQVLRLAAEAATEQLENIMSRIDDQFMALDREERYIYVNDRVSQVLGKPKEEFLGKKMGELFPNVVQSRFYSEMQRAITEQAIINFEYYYEAWQSWYEIRMYPSANGVSIFIADVSDRKRAELQFQESQRFNQQIAQTLPGLIFVYDLLERRNIYVNRQVSDLLGYTVEEVQAIGSDLLPTLTHPDDLPQLLAYLESFGEISDGTIRKIEHRILHANGEWRWLSIRSLVFNRDQRGIPRQILGVALDVSDRKQTEDELRSREIELNFANERFEQAAIAVNCLIYDWDVIQDYVIRTEGLTRILGYSLAEAEPTGQWWRALIHPDDLPRIEAEAAAQLQQGDRYNTEYRIRHKNNDWLYVQDYGVVTRDAQGHWLRVVGSTIDISDRKRAEAALREQELFLHDLTNNVPVLLWTALPDGTLNFVSQSWINYTGLDLAVVNREGWQQLIHPDDYAETRRRWNQSATTGQPYENTHRVKRADGQFHWCISRALLTYDDQQNPLRWVGSAVDIEHQKQIEFALTETTELLKKSNQELDRFAYIVSHDLKAPLRAIANLSQWMEEDLQGQLPPENQEQIRLLLQRVFRMEALIDGLLAYSRADRSSITAETVDVGQLITEIIDSLAPPPSFRIIVQPEMPKILTKRLLLSQIFTNLIGNAIKHHDRPDGQVEISARIIGKHYEFAIADDGPGIEPQYHEKVFEIFQTLKARDSQENTGIGLSIVKKIIETEGGQLQLESAEGKGATFLFTWRALPPT